MAITQRVLCDQRSVNGIISAKQEFSRCCGNHWLPEVFVCSWTRTEIALKQSEHVEPHLKSKHRNTITNGDLCILCVEVIHYIFTVLLLFAGKHLWVKDCSGSKY